MELTYKKFVKYLKVNKSAEARTTKDWKPVFYKLKLIPSGTLIKFKFNSVSEEYVISSYIKDQYKYPFVVKFIIRWKDDYSGKFKI